MCWPFRHSYKPIAIGEKNILDAGFRSNILYRCNKCYRFKVVKIKGNWKEKDIIVVDNETEILYNELIYAVEDKFNGESRHMTALRLIKEGQCKDIEATHSGEIFPDENDN